MKNTSDTPDPVDAGARPIDDNGRSAAGFDAARGAGIALAVCLSIGNDDCAAEGLNAAQADGGAWAVDTGWIDRQATGRATGRGTGLPAGGDGLDGWPASRVAMIEGDASTAAVAPGDTGLTTEVDGPGSCGASGAARDLSASFDRYRVTAFSFPRVPACSPTRRAETQVVVLRYIQPTIA